MTISSKTGNDIRLRQDHSEAGGNDAETGQNPVRRRETGGSEGDSPTPLRAGFKGAAPKSAGQNLPPDLLHQLRRAETSKLLSLVEDYGRSFTIRELRQALLNPYADAEVLQALGTNRKLLAAREAKAAIARHRRTPEPLAMRLVPNLSWRELTEITLDIRIRSPVRRVAERYLVQRLPRLTAGERINLARRSVDTVAARLIAESGARSSVPKSATAVQSQARIIEAGLENPRLSERALLDVISAESSTPRLLDRIAAHPRWGSRYEVRAALCQNPSTPYRIILQHLATLRGDILERIVTHPDHAEFLRAKARELMQERAQATSIGLESSKPASPEKQTDPEPHIAPPPDELDDGDFIHVIEI